MKKVKQVLAACLSAALLLALAAGCSSSPASSDVSIPVAAAGMQDGSYNATVEGHNGPITVATEIRDGKLAGVEVTEETETADIAGGALQSVPAAIVAGNTLSVDVVAGATVTSRAIVAAVEDAIQQAGGNPDDFREATGPADTRQLSADIVVVGGGASGVSAAVAAANEGVEVILIEKTGVIGGASNLSFSAGFTNSSYALENGAEQDLEAIIADWIENCHWRVDAAAIRQYVYNTGDTYDWLMEQGYTISAMDFFGSVAHLLPTDYDSREGLLRGMLANSVEAGGGQVLTGTTGKSLIMDGNAVAGVIAEQNDGTILEISAKSVIIATGGYAGNFEMVSELFGFEGVNGGLSQNIGEGLEMAWEAGAMVPQNIGGQMLHQTLAKATLPLYNEFDQFQATMPMMLCYLPNFMNVSSAGSRFRDEASLLDAVAAANTAAYQGSYHYVVVSQTHLDLLEAEGMNGIGALARPGMPPEFYYGFADQFTLEEPWENATAVFDKMVELGYGYKGGTVEELAQNAGMDVATFTEQFNDYLRYIEAGEDTQFGKPADYLIEMGEGPYYIIISEVNNLGSIGGLQIDTRFRVLDESRVAIPGLYAVGNEGMGVLYNDTYVGSGVGLGYAFTSGRLGGAYAAAALED